MYSETDDEKEDNPDGKGEEEGKDAEDEEVDRPQMYNCANIGVCGGFENDIDNECCLVCDTPRPSIEELMKAAASARKAEKAAAKAAEAENAGSEAEDEGEPLYHLRLKKLRRDVRHIISHD